MSLPDAEDHLDDLVDLGLVESAQGGRYRLHDLVRLYAHQRLEQDDDDATVAASRRRMVAWLLATLTDAGGWFEPISADPAGSRFSTQHEADAWIRLEAEHWYPALGLAAAADQHEAIINAASALHWFSDWWKHWPHWQEVFTLALESAVALSDLNRQAEFLNYIAWTHSLLHRLDLRQTLAYAEQAMAAARAAGNVTQQAWAWQYTAYAHHNLGDHHAGRDAARQAAEGFEQIGDMDAYCQTLMLHGLLAVGLGEPAQGVRHFQAALELVEDPASGMTTTIARATVPHVLGHLAWALGQAGRSAEGIPLAQRAVSLLEDKAVGSPLAWTLRVLGELYADDKVAEARQCLLRAADIYEAAGLSDRAATCRELAAAKHALGSSQVISG